MKNAIKPNVGLATFGLATSILVAGCSLAMKGNDDSHSRALSVQDEGSTSALHDANTKKIVFAKSEIPRDGSSANLETTFRADEPIWSRYYLSKSLAKQIATQANAVDSCKWENRRQVNIFAKVGDSSERQYRTMPAGEKTWGFWTTAQTPGDAKPLLPTENVFLPQG